MLIFHLFQKPLRRLQIEEIGLDDGKTIREAIAKTEASQSDAKRRVTEQDGKMFEHFVSPNQSLASGDLQVLDHGGKSQAGEASGQGEQSEQGGQGEQSEQGGQGEQRGLDPQQVEGPSTKQAPTNTLPSASPRVPAVPTSSFQFQADWKILKKHPDKFYLYFKVG